jgi:hypothetical protein
MELYFYMHAKTKKEISLAATVNADLSCPGRFIYHRVLCI